MKTLVLIGLRSKEIEELLTCLEENGYTPQIIARVEQLKDFVTSGETMVVLLDTGTAGEDGVGVYRRLRVQPAFSGCRLIVRLKDTKIPDAPWLSVADDFFLDIAPSAEVLERIRRAFMQVNGDVREIISVGGLTIDPERYEVRYRSCLLSLTYKEFELLRYLAENAGKVFSREHLLREIWGYDYYGGTRTVDVHIRRLRAKLSEVFADCISTVHGVGYKMESKT
ncbi:MAG: response regulator transcription factor [bacterium]